MARGNDGNLLQHCVETELAERLAVLSPNSPLFVTFTHGMAPTEQCNPVSKKPGEARPYKALKHWLEKARYPPRDINLRPAVVRAYRSSNASWSAYPNSARLLAYSLGAERLRGYVCETDPAKADALEQEWAGTGVAVHRASWRGLLRHAPFREVQGPWLMSLDPNTFKQNELSDEDFSINEADLRTVVSATAPLLGSEQRPGALAVFCYGLTPPGQTAFRAAVDRTIGALAADLRSVEVAILEARAGGGNRHVGAVATNVSGLREELNRVWTELMSWSK